MTAMPPRYFKHLASATLSEFDKSLLRDAGLALPDGAGEGAR
jgi:hypothetical protein